MYHLAVPEIINQAIILTLSFLFQQSLLETESSNLPFKVRWKLSSLWKVLWLQSQQWCRSIDINDIISWLNEA